MIDMRCKSTIDVFQGPHYDSIAKSEKQETRNYGISKLFLRNSEIDTHNRTEQKNQDTGSNETNTGQHERG